LFHGGFLVFRPTKDPCRQHREFEIGEAVSVLQRPARRVGHRAFIARTWSRVLVRPYPQRRMRGRPGPHSSLAERDFLLPKQRTPIGIRSSGRGDLCQCRNPVREAHKRRDAEWTVNDDELVITGEARFDAEGKQLAP